jgi:hypothetical protein
VHTESLCSAINRSDIHSAAKINAYILYVKVAGAVHAQKVVILTAIMACWPSYEQRSPPRQCFTCFSIGNRCRGRGRKLVRRTYEVPCPLEEDEVPDKTFIF